MQENEDYEKTEENEVIEPALKGKTKTRGPKVLVPGDILDVIIKLRKLASLYDTVAYTLNASFVELGGEELEKQVKKTRYTTEISALRLYELLDTLEKTSHYQELRERTLNIRAKKDKY